MKAHDGEILEQLIVELGIKKKNLAQMLGMHRNSITNMLDSYTISDERLLKIGSILKADMPSYYERLKRKYYQDTTPLLHGVHEEDPDSNYEKNSLKKCYEEVEYWKNKAYENLEKYNKLLINYHKGFAQQE